MARLVIDAMSGDNGSNIVINAIKDFKRDYPNTELVVCGKKEELESIKDLATIVDARDVVPMEAGALQVLRMKNSSMMVAINYMKENNYDAVVSSGSTGGYLTAATVSLRMIPGIKRAALCTCFPTKDKNKKLTLLDCGANNENSAEELAQFALMGRLYAQAVYGTEDPKTYLLSNGSEDEKGTAEIKEAHKILRESNFPGFMGNLEANDALEGNCDVLVANGFAGNVFLKTTEAVAKWMGSMFKGVFTKNMWTKIGYLHVKGGLEEMKQIMDYKSVGGAILLGVNGIAFKAHGNADAYNFYHALRVANLLAEMNIVEKIKKGVTNEGN